MKKKELLRLKKLSVTARMQQLVEEDVGEEKRYSYREGHYIVYEKELYIRAAVMEKILKVALFPRERIAQGETKPQYEIYISSEENKYLTYDYDEERWLAAMIENLRTEHGYGYCYMQGKRPWYTDTTKKIINDYLGTKKLEPNTAIMKFQQGIKDAHRKVKHKREIDKIDEVMNAVPDYPKDFDSWILDQAFFQERYIFYRASGKKTQGWCSHCEKDVELKKNAHSTIHQGAARTAKARFNSRHMQSKNALKARKWLE